MSNANTSTVVTIVILSIIVALLVWHIICRLAIWAHKPKGFARVGETDMTGTHQAVYAFKRNIDPRKYAKQIHTLRLLDPVGLLFDLLNRKIGPLVDLSERTLKPINGYIVPSNSLSATLQVYDPTDMRKAIAGLSLPSDRTTGGRPMRR